MGFKVYDDITTFNKTINSRISLLSQMIAANPESKESIVNNQIDVESKLLFEDILENHPTIDLIVLANKDIVRIYHPIESMIGGVFVGGDEDNILLNGIPYLSTAKGGTGNVQTRAFRAIYDGEEIIGFVMVSAYQKTIMNSIGSILITNLISLAIFTALSFLLAYFMSKYIKNILLGNEPGQLRVIYIQQGHVLDSLNDAIIVTTTDHQLIYQNKVAFEMIEKIYGESNLANINDFIKNYLAPLAKYKNEKYHKEIAIKNTVILVRTINDYSKLYNIYTINNKSELSKLANELTGVNHALSSLRTIQSQNTNRLHVILGLLQLKEYDEAIKTILNEQIEDITMKQIIDKISNTTIRALLIGKFIQANQLGIFISLSAQSHLNDDTKFLSTRNLLIILGNLLENAFEALKDVNSPAIEVSIENKEDLLYISIKDNGSGIDPNIIHNIYELNVSTKGTQRGIGLYVVKNIVDSHHGTLDIQSDENGTVFTIMINEERTQ